MLIYCLVFLQALFWFCSPNLPQNKERDIKEFYKQAPVIVFCMHEINKGGKYSLSSQEFEELIKVLMKTKYTVSSIRDWLSETQEKPRPRVILTFDDGGPSQLNYALPVLQKAGFGATLYVYLNRHRATSSYFRRLRNLPSSFEIGSHTLSHSNLKAVFKKNTEASYRSYYKEIMLSRIMLQSYSRQQIDSYAWPYGRYDKKQIKDIFAAGYKNQVSTDYRFASKKDVASIIPRFTISQPNAIKRAKNILQLYNKAWKLYLKRLPVR